MVSTAEVEMTVNLNNENMPLSLVGDRYRLKRLVGKGGMGAVYQAYDEQLKRFVAVKCLLCTTDSSSREKALQEAFTLSSINHPNVMQIFDVVTIEDQIWLVTEWVDGHVLSELEGAVHPLVTSAIMTQVYQGLAASHEKGIVHRDIKPANIMVTLRGRVVLLDYGVALAPGISSGETIVGSLRYTDSRILEGQKADQYSDLFSASLVALELLKGKPVLPELAPLPAYRYIRENLTGRAEKFVDGLYPPLAELMNEYLYPHQTLAQNDANGIESHFCADRTQDVLVELSELSPYKVLEKFNDGTFAWDAVLERTEEVTNRTLSSDKLPPRKKAAWFAYSEHLKNANEFIEQPDLTASEVAKLDKRPYEGQWQDNVGSYFQSGRNSLITAAIFAVSFLMIWGISKSPTFGGADPETIEAPEPPTIQEVIKRKSESNKVSSNPNEEISDEEANEVVKEAVKQAVKEAMVEASRDQIGTKSGGESNENENSPKLTVKTFVLDEPGRLYINGVNQGFIVEDKPISISFGTHEIWIERNNKLIKLAPVTISDETASVIRVEKKRQL